MTDELPALPPGRYRVEGTLGAGACGTVLRALDLDAGRPVALKVLRDGATGAALARFRREAELAAGLDAHPGIVRVHGAGRIEGRPCIVFELVEGARTLDQVVRGEPPRRRVERVRDVARALGHAHARGVVHRDVKSANILVDREDRVRLTDFGVALDLDADRLTRTGALVGTPYAMAPEQLAGGRQAQGPPVDVWALGVLLHEALTGRPPFEAENLQGLMVQVLGAPAPAPSSSSRDVDRALDAIVARALAKAPGDRFPHGDAFADALDAWLEGRADRPAAATLLSAGVAIAAALAVAVAVVLAARRPADAGPAAPATRGAAAGAPAAPASLPDGWGITLAELRGFDLVWENRGVVSDAMRTATTLSFDVTGPAVARGETLQLPLRVARVVVDAGELAFDSTRPAETRGAGKLGRERAYFDRLVGSGCGLDLRPRTGQVLRLRLPGMPDGPITTDPMAGLVARGLRSVFEPEHLARGLGAALHLFPERTPPAGPWTVPGVVWGDPRFGVAAALTLAPTEPGRLGIAGADVRVVPGKGRPPDGLRGGRVGGWLRHDGRRVLEVLVESAIGVEADPDRFGASVRWTGRFDPVAAPAPLDGWGVTLDELEGLELEVVTSDRGYDGGAVRLHLDRAGPTAGGDVRTVPLRLARVELQHGTGLALACDTASPASTGLMSAKDERALRALAGAPVQLAVRAATGEVVRFDPPAWRAGGEGDASLRAQGLDATRKLLEPEGLARQLGSLLRTLPGGPAPADGWRLPGATVWVEENEGVRLDLRVWRAQGASTLSIQGVGAGRLVSGGQRDDPVRVAEASGSLAHDGRRVVEVRLDGRLDVDGLAERRTRLRLTTRFPR